MDDSVQSNEIINEDVLKNSATRSIIAASFGNILEFYDFTIYAAFAVPISKSFFPTDSQFFSLLISFTVYAIGFFIRPVGAALLGAYADRKGRRTALSLTIGLMAVGTAMIAFCPTFAQIGIAAPLIVLVARIIQGFSVGGEFGGSTALVAENAPASRRGFYAAMQPATQGATGILSGIVAVSVAAFLEPESVNTWGWRIALTAGLLIVPVGIYIRRSIDEPIIFKQEHSFTKDESIRKIVLIHWRKILTGIFVVLLWTVSANIVIYFPTFASRELNIPLTTSYVGPVAVGCVMLFSPISGILSDRYGRKKIMLAGGLLLGMIAYPAFYYLIEMPTARQLVISQLSIACAQMIYSAPVSALLAELFPTKVRATGTAMCYGLSVAIFGGTSPALITFLIHRTGQPLVIAFYLICAAVASLIAVLFVRDDTGKSLSEI